jgi:hypothetical protein
MRILMHILFSELPSGRSCVVNLREKISPLDQDIESVLRKFGINYEISNDMRL